MTYPEGPRRVVIVGASLAGLRAAETLRGEGFAGSVELVGQEPHMPYSRPPLSKQVLLGGEAADPTLLRSAGALEASWHLADPAVALSTADQVVTLASGKELAYDRLLISTGVRARWPAQLSPGRRVTALRTLADAQRLAGALGSARRVIIIGAGFVGCEVAAAARSRGLAVALVDRSAAPLASAIGDWPAALVGGLHAGHGVRLFPGHGASELLGSPDVPEGVRLADGTVVPGDLVVVGTGSAPNTEWLAGSGVPVRDGVLCDATLKVEGVEGIWAAGDVVRWAHPALGGRETRVEHWSHAAMSGMAAARNMLRNRTGDSYGQLPEFWSDQYDVTIRGVGLTGRGLDFEVVEGEPPGPFVGVYRDRGRVVGGLAFNATKQLARLRRQILPATATSLAS